AVRPRFPPLCGALFCLAASSTNVTMSELSDEETDDPHYADRRNFYKVEKWSRDGLRVELMLYAGNNLDKARRIFERTSRQRPRTRLTIRQRMRVVDEWPRHETML